MLFSLIPSIATLTIAFMYPLFAMPAFFGGTTETRLLICLLLHPIVLEAAEAISRSSGAEKVASQLLRGKLTLEQAEEKTIQNSLGSFPIKQLMAFFRRFMLLNIGTQEATIAAIVGASIEESLERGFLVEFDTAIRTWRDMPKLKGNDLRLQQLVWMCDANQSAVAELNAIVVSSFAQVLLQRHGVILALGYTAGEPLDVALVFVQLMIELTLEIAVDIVAMWAESEHGIPVTHYLSLVQSSKVFIFQTAVAIVALSFALFAFLRHPHILSCDSSYVCDCVEQPQYTEWLAEECNATAANHSSAVYDETDDGGVFDGIDPLAIVVALVTGLAMLALISLSVLFARYRKRNVKVESLVGGLALAHREKEKAEAFNLELKRSLQRAQKEVDKAVGDSNEMLKQYKIKYDELTFEDEIGHGQVLHTRRQMSRAFC